MHLGKPTRHFKGTSCASTMCFGSGTPPGIRILTYQPPPPSLSFSKPPRTSGRTSSVVDPRKRYPCWANGIPPDDPRPVFVRGHDSRHDSLPYLTSRRLWH